MAAALRAEVSFAWQLKPGPTRQEFLDQCPPTYPKAAAAKAYANSLRELILQFGPGTGLDPHA